MDVNVIDKNDVVFSVTGKDYELEVKVTNESHLAKAKKQLNAFIKDIKDSDIRGVS